MLEWVKFPKGSWHLTAGITSRGGMVRTRCGKWAAQNADQSPHLPENQRSCERCYQLRDHANR